MNIVKALNLNAKVLRSFVRVKTFNPKKYTQDGIRVYLSIFSVVTNILFESLTYGKFGVFFVR